MYLEPKKEYGGRAKYEDVNPHASDYSYEPIDDKKEKQPLFKISIKRARNEEGKLESLENSVEIKHKKPLHTKTKYNFITQKFKVKKRDKNLEREVDDLFENTLSEVDFEQREFDEPQN